MRSAVIFDIDNTLYPYDPCNNAGVRVVFELLCHRFGISESVYEKVISAAKKDVKSFNKGTAACHNRFLYFQRICEYLDIFSPELVIEMYTLFWSTYFDHMKLFPGAAELLRYLKANGIKIGFCTDLTAHIQFKKIIILGISDIPDAVVTSEECGAEKPSPLMFENILKKLKVSAEETVMVGDSIEKDILGARESGILPILYGNQSSKYIYANNYRELKDLLERICLK